MIIFWKFDDQKIFHAEFRYLFNIFCVRVAFDDAWKSTDLFLRSKISSYDPYKIFLDLFKLFLNKNKKKMHFSLISCETRPL